MKNKNQYYVINVYSNHNNFTNAQANCEQQKQAGKESYIVYRWKDCIVTEDVKKNIKKTPEGI